VNDHTKSVCEGLEATLGQAGKAWRRDSAPTSPDFGKAILARARAEKAEPEVARVLPVLSRRVWLGMAAAAAVVLAAATGALVLRQTSVGRLELRSGRVAVSGVAGKFNLLSDGTTVATSANSNAIVDMDDGRIRMFLSESTSMHIDGEDRVTLAGGGTWINVRPESGFFQVATDRGTIEVHGTSFGIVRSGADFKVYLASGEIRLRQGDAVTTLRPDEYVEIKGGEAAAVRSADDREPPAWTTRLYREYQIAHSAEFFPSSGVK